MGNQFISPLRRGVRANRPDSVRLVLEKAGPAAPDLINEDVTADCFLDVCQRNASPVLNTAIGYQRWEIVELLLEHGADPSAPGHGGETPLHKAARQNNLALARRLVYYGADVTARDALGAIPLHSAAVSLVAGFWNKCETLVYLLEEAGLADRDVDAADYDGHTPLHHAAVRGNEAAVRYLISKGANVDARNAKGATPADLATDEKIKIILRDSQNSGKEARNS